MKGTWKINTGFKEWRYYLAGFASVPVIVYTCLFLGKHWPASLHLRGLQTALFGFYCAIPFLIGFILGRYFKSHSKSFCWGFFLGFVLFAQPMSSGDGSLFPELMMAAILGLAVIIAISVGVLLEDILSSFLRKRKGSKPDAR